MNFEELKQTIVDIDTWLCEEQDDWELSCYWLCGNLTEDSDGGKTYQTHLIEKLGEFEFVHHGPMLNDPVNQTVYYFKDHDIYVALNDTFDSWGNGGGDGLMELYQVSPKQKTITIYESV